MVLENGKKYIFPIIYILILHCKHTLDGDGPNQQKRRVDVVDGGIIVIGAFGGGSVAETSMCY